MLRQGRRPLARRLEEPSEGGGVDDEALRNRRAGCHEAGGRIFVPGGVRMAAVDEQDVESAAALPRRLLALADHSGRELGEHVSRVQVHAPEILFVVRPAVERQEDRVGLGVGRLRIGGLRRRIGHRIAREIDEGRATVGDRPCERVDRCRHLLGVEVLGAGDDEAAAFERVADEADVGRRRGQFRLGVGAVANDERVAVLRPGDAGARGQKRQHHQWPCAAGNSAAGNVHRFKPEGGRADRPDRGRPAKGRGPWCRSGPPAPWRRAGAWRRAAPRWHAPSRHTGRS